MEQKEISQAVIRRMPRYYRYLGELIDDGVERISSNDLSKRMNVTASQIRQDLNNFGGFGQQGYGYNVKYLFKLKNDILDNKFTLEHGNKNRKPVNALSEAEKQKIVNLYRRSNASIRKFCKFYHTRSYSCIYNILKENGLIK